MNFPLQHEFESFKRNPNSRNAKQLYDAVEKSDLQIFLSSKKENIILIALLSSISSLNSNNRKEIITYLFRTVEKIVDQSRVHTLVSLKTILVILLKEIYSVNDDRTFVCKDLPEELKLSILNCFNTTFKRSESDVLEQFYVAENRTFLAEIFALCTDIIKFETYRQLKISAINCLLSSMQIHDEADFSDVVFRSQIADIVFIMVPRIHSVLIQVVIGDSKQGQTLIAIAIKCLGRFLCLIFENSSQEEAVSFEEQIKLMVMNVNKPKSTEDDMTILKKVSPIQGNTPERSGQWLLAASRKIEPSLTEILKLGGTQDERIKSELKIFCENILQRCQQNMPTCIPKILQMRLSLDTESLLKDQKIVFSDNILDIIEDLFISTLTKMPRMMYTGDEDEQLVVGSELYGLLAVLKKADRLKTIMSNERIIHLFSSALIAAVELNLQRDLFEGNIRIYEIGGTPAETIIDLQSKTPWKTYRNIRNDSFILKIESICKLIGDSGAAGEFLIESLLESLHNNSIKCNEILVLLQMIMKSKKVSMSVRGPIIDELLQDIRWTLSMEVTSNTNEQYDKSNKSEWFEDRTEGLYESAISIRIKDIKPSDKPIQPETIINLNDVKFNILHTCLILETLGICAESSKDEFQSYLLFCLHRILEKAASNYQMIQMSAVLALNNVRNAFNLSSIADLIVKNSDYVTHSIGISLKYPDRSETALDVLRVVLHYCSLESIPHLETIITTVLSENSKVNQSSNSISFLKLFSMVLKAIKISTNDDDKKLFETNEKIANKCIDWISYLNDDEVQIDDDNDSDVNMTTDDVEMNEQEQKQENEETKESLSPLIRQTADIMNRCIKSLSSTIRDEKIVAMEAISVGLDILYPYEDELLPIVHLIWTPFMYQCIRDTSAVTLRRCIALLSKLAKYAKMFIYKRCQTDILPFIMKYLQELSKICRKDYKSFLYEQTQEFRFLQELLTEFGHVLMNININERDLNLILDSTIWLLDKNQPKELQNKCLDFICQLAEYDGPAVYVKILKHYNDSSGRYNENCKLISQHILRLNNSLI